MDNVKIAYTVRKAISKDGTEIGYKQLGTGPGLILVPGALMNSDNFMRLGEFLSDYFTVYIPDRRGRGISSAPNNGFGLVREAEDMQAIIVQTNTSDIFGLSSGAIIALQTALITPAIRKVALYEPPIPPNSSMHREWYAKYEQAITKKNYGEAFIHIIKGTTGSLFFSLVPMFIAAPIMNLVISKQPPAEKGGMLLTAAIAAFKYDYQVMRESENLIEKAKHLDADVLLLGGSKTKRFLKDVLDRLEAVLPKVRRIEIPGADHIAADNSGKPAVVAGVLRSFFSAR